MSDPTIPSGLSAPSTLRGGDVPPPPAPAAAALTLAAPPAKPPGMLFADLGLKPEVLKALEDMGFQRAMDVQAATIPAVRKGKDLMVQSRTGSGKTAAFGIPFANDV